MQKLRVFLKQIGLTDIFRNVFKSKTIYVFGDSHAFVFPYINKRYPFYSYYFDTTAITGATAVGMRNPNSKTNALPIFQNKISSIKDKSSTLLFLLGEIDTGFVIWYRADKYNESVDKQLEESINAYQKFLLAIQNQGFKNIIIQSAPLPTIKDNQTWGKIANLRKEVNANQIERTQLTLEYNKRLKNIAKQNGYHFLDLDQYLLNKNSSLIDNKYLNKDANDHHLDNKAYSNIIIKQISF